LEFVAVVADDVAAPSMYAVPTAAATADKAVTATFEALTATFALRRRGFRTFGFAGRSLRGDGRAGLARASCRYSRTAFWYCWSRSAAVPTSGTPVAASYQRVRAP
jgi:hypothetical protein